MKQLYLLVCNNHDDDDGDVIIATSGKLLECMHSRQQSDKNKEKVDLILEKPFFPHLDFCFYNQ